MARSQSEIENSMINTIENQDSSIEVDYGPVLDVFIKPTSSEFALAERRTDKLSQFYSTSFIKTATEEEVATYVTNFALPEGAGQKSKGHVYFITYRRLNPGEQLLIPIGTLVSNEDSTLLYVTTQQKIMYGDFISSYVNSENSWYEIIVPVEAVAIGKNFDLPASRIRKLLTRIPGIALVQNRTKISGGEDEESKERKFERVENAFLGQDKGSVGGLISKVESYNPNLISACSIVRSNERKLFTRFSNTLALDVYVTGKEPVVETQETVLKETTYSIPLEKQPVLNVSRVLINGNEISHNDFYLEKDLGSLHNSPRAKDKVGLRNIVTPGTTVTVEYSYNALLENIEKDIFSDNEDELYVVDSLVRSMLVKDFVISAILIFNSSANSDETRSQTTQALLDLINTNTPGAVYRPEIIKQLVIERVSGLSDIVFLKFTLLNESTLDVETVSLDKNAIANLSEEDILFKG